MSEIVTSEPEISVGKFAKGGWVVDLKSPWSDGDESWLETVLTMADHFKHPHDPIECQRQLDPRWNRAEWKLLREEKHLTLRQLAAKLNVDPGSISRWESGTRWPENVDYEMFLKESADRLCETAGLQVFLLQSKRDGWMTDAVRAAKDDPILDRFDHWDVIFKVGGLFDRWRETGSLPRWTPQDAGYTG